MERVTKRTFVFNLDWADILSGYSPEVRLSVYDAVMAYAATGELVAMDGVPAMAFAFIRREMDRMGRQYEETCEQNRRNGLKGGAPKGNANAKKQSCENNRAVDLNEENNRNNRAVEKTTETTERLKKQPKTTEDNGSVEKTTETTLYDSDDDNDNKKKTSLRDVKEKDSSHTGLEEKKAVGLLQGFDDIVAILKGDSAWQEIVAMSNRMEVEAVERQIDAFALHCRAAGEEHVTVASARRHFNGWIKRQKKPTANEDYDDKLARRRGTEPSARSGEDYTGAL